METNRSFVWDQCIVCFKPIKSYEGYSSVYYAITYSCGCEFRCCNYDTNAAIYRFVKENGIPEIDE